MPQVAEGDRLARGDSSEDYAARPTRFSRLLSRMYPVVLRLAASSEGVAHDLFSELVTQLVHWFTKAARREGAEATALLDSIMEGLVDPTNAALRDLCASLAAEYLHWAWKHLPGESGMG